MKKQIDYETIRSELQRQLDALQFGDRNSARRVMVVDVPQLDYGPLLSHLMLGLQLGFILARCCVFRPIDDFTGLSAFAALSDISHTEINDTDLVHASFDVEQFNDIVQFDYPEFWENYRLRRYFFPWAPTEFQASHCPRLLFDGEFQRRLKLVDPLQQWLETSCAPYRNDAPAIGVYARQSDAEKEMVIAPDELLIQRVRSIAEQNHVEGIVVAGDDEFIENIKTSAAEVVQIVLPGLIPQSISNQTQLSLSDMFELHVLSACDWIVGRTSSDIARHAAARIGARTMRCDCHSLVPPQQAQNGLARFFGRTSAQRVSELS